MSEAYVECLVQTRNSMLLKILQTVLIILTVILAFVGISFFVIALIPAIGTGIGAYFAYLNADVEYEYLYLDKELTIDKVMAKSKRKHVGVFTLERMEIFAPIHSYYLDNYKNRNVKVLDYSIGVEEQPDLRYALYYEGGVKLILSPSEEMVKVLKNVAPRKVYTS